MGLTLASVWNGETCIMTILDSAPALQLHSFELGRSGGRRSGPAFRLNGGSAEEKSVAKYESDCIKSDFTIGAAAILLSQVFYKRRSLYDPPRGRGTPWFPPCGVPEPDSGWCIVSPCSKLARLDERMVPPHSSFADLTSRLISCPSLYQHWGPGTL